MHFLCVLGSGATRKLSVGEKEPYRSRRRLELLILVGVHGTRSGLEGVADEGQLERNRPS